jgi:hypothetical protein
MSAPFRRMRSATHRCGCLEVGSGQPCRYQAISRVVFRFLRSAPVRRVDACGVHDHLLAIELAERNAVDVVVKSYVRPGRRRAGAREACSV